VHDWALALVDHVVLPVAAVRLTGTGVPSLWIDGCPELPRLRFPLAATPACRSVDAGSRSGLGLAFRTETPVNDLGFIDLVAHVIDRREAGRGAGGAIDVGHAAAATADHVVVIVADPGLEACR